MSNRSRISVRHNFETGHRLPFLEGKCESLHGHSWWVEVIVEAPEVSDVLVEFGSFKRGLRGWVDEHLDHGLMLGRDDPLAPMLSPLGKVYVFGEDGMVWPTVENVARLLARRAQEILGTVTRVHGAEVVEVRVQETHVNSASWLRGDR